MRTIARIASWLCLSGGAALAQTTLLSVDGSAPGEMFGAAVAGAGDANGDGVPDIAVGVAKGASGALTPGVPHMPMGVVYGALVVIGAVFWVLGMRSFYKRAIG